MTEETQTQGQPKNTVATVGMRFSIIGLIALLTLFLSWLGFPMLIVGFILGIVGLFYKPRGKARIAVCIPLVIFIITASFICYIWSSIKAPFTEWYNRWTPTFEQLSNEEGFDNERFNDIANEEINNVRSSITEESFNLLLENSTGSNTLEKGAYVILGLVQQVAENTLERYNNELPEVNNDTVDLDNDTNDENDDENQPENEESENETLEISSEGEETDIEQIIDALE